MESESEDPIEQRRELIFGHFDDVCDSRRLKPSQLEAADDETLVGWIREVVPAKWKNRPIDVALIRELVKEYAVDDG